jgi:hypothetical protein
MSCDKKTYIEFDYKHPFIEIKEKKITKNYGILNRVRIDQILNLYSTLV